MVHLKINALPEAEGLFTKAIEFSPSGANYRAYYSRGYANELQGDFSNAVSSFLFFESIDSKMSIALE